MIKAERQQKIKALVQDRGQVDVASLSTQLNVTEVTIRSDLEQLEKQGYLKRLHGGAVLNEQHGSPQEISDLLAGRVFPHNPGKERLARLAASLVEERECIFLGPGETCFYLSKELLHFKKLTVLTNNLYVANVLSSNMNIHLTLTGGQLVQGNYCFAGDKIRALTSDLYLTKSFFAPDGVDLKAGYTVGSSDEVTIYREISSHSRETILMMDLSKFNRISFVKLGDLDLCPTVVTEAVIPETYAEQFRENGVKRLHPEK